ncbi:putative transcriptional regulatory protein [Gracilariopsis chorda]|uniref:Putative transcriptional regulatory protein n=1 Tax=Gracilariopsis chorda TaxID=448386 RepID=A0A2V3J1T9_9FLOR|nr:putative transcriptional regulatory protein [Gracilariopsis chorda]|eukprot:PXF48305.1 putative transcriptional regulatory protein [Gracilariopsis chorda]
MFTERHTVLLRDIDKQYVDDIIMFGIDQGADDVVLIDDESIEFLCSTAKERDEVRRALTEKFCFLDTANLHALQHVHPKVFVAISDEAATRSERLLSALNDHTDVLDVIHNAKFERYDEEKL